MRQAMQDATGDGHAVLDKLSIDEPEQQVLLLSEVGSDWLLDVVPLFGTCR